MKSVAITSFVALTAAAPVNLQQRDPQFLYDLGGFVGQTAGNLLSIPANIIGGVADDVYDVADTFVSPLLPWNWRQVDGEAAPQQLQKRDPQFLYDLGGFVGQTAGNLLSIPANIIGGVADDVYDVADTFVSPLLPWNWRQVDGEAAPQQLQKRDPQFLSEVGGFVEEAADNLFSDPANTIGGVAEDVYDVADTFVSPLLPWNWRQVNGETAASQIQKRDPQVAADLGNFIGQTAGNALLLPGQLVGGVVGGLANGLVGPFLPWNWRQVEAQVNAQETAQENAPVVA